MQREDVVRAAIGLMALLLPYVGVYTVIPLAAVFFLDPGTRLLSASLGLLLILRSALSLVNTDLPLYIIAISFVASTFAPLAFRKFEALAGSVIYLLITVALGYPLASLILAGSLSSERILFLAILGGLSGAFLHHASRERDFTVPFGTAMVMWLFSFDYPLPDLHRILLICIFALVLGIGAYWAKAADSDAVLSETIVCLLVILFGGLTWFMLLLAFYLLGGGFTRYGYAHKAKLGIAQSHGGVRGYKNVYSNSLVPLVLAVCYGIYRNEIFSEIFVFAFIASVATANGDTLASEIGETSRSKPRMITTLKETEPGVDGGVTPLGEAASLVGALIIGILAMVTGMAGAFGIVAGIVGGFLGTNFDSLLGATLQRRGILSNNGVNLVATGFGALVGAVLWYILQIIYG